MPMPSGHQATPQRSQRPIESAQIGTRGLTTAGTIGLETLILLGQKALVHTRRARTRTYSRTILGSDPYMSEAVSHVLPAAKQSAKQGLLSGKAI